MNSNYLHDDFLRIFFFGRMQSMLYGQREKILYLYQFQNQNSEEEILNKQTQQNSKVTTTVDHSSRVRISAWDLPISRSEGRQITLPMLYKQCNETLGLGGLQKKGGKKLSYIINLFRAYIFLVTKILSLFSGN